VAHVAHGEDAGQAGFEQQTRPPTSSRPDLVLMDVHRPGIDGPEATRRILDEASDRQRRPVVFLLSIDEATDYARLTAGCGASAYLPKAEVGPTSRWAAWAAAMEGGVVGLATGRAGTRPCTVVPPPGCERWVRRRRRALDDAPAAPLSHHAA
jgi:CheY-like chemotaxis protein